MLRALTFRAGGSKMDRASGNAKEITRRVLTGAAAFAFAGAPPGPALAADPLASGQFRDEVVDVLRRNRPNWRLESPSDPTTVIVDRKPAYLANLYLSVRSGTRAEREVGILRFFDAVIPAIGGLDDKTFDAVRSRLRARIVNAELVSRSAEDKLMLLTRPFSPKARIAYVVDSPRAMTYVSKGKLDQWAVAADAVHAAAIENLDMISRGVLIEAHAPHPGSGLYVIGQNPDGYAAARLLAPKFMERMGEELGPEHFVGVPVRDLFLAWSVDCSIKPQMAALVTKYASTGAYPVTDELFVWSAEGLRTATPAELFEHRRS